MPDRCPATRDAALTAAEARCAGAGARLTPWRRRVLDAILDAGRPIGAYPLRERLDDEEGRLAPQQVYRALDFLVAQGLIHRLASWAEYVPCDACGTGHLHGFLICRRCGTTAEIHDEGIEAALAAAVARVGFRPGHRTVEVEGLCGECAVLGSWNSAS